MIRVMRYVRRHRSGRCFHGEGLCRPSQLYASVPQEVKHVPHATKGLLRKQCPMYRGDGVCRLCKGRDPRRRTGPTLFWNEIQRKLPDLKKGGMGSLIAGRFLSE